MNYKPIELGGLWTVSLAKRPSIVRSKDFARPARSASSFAEFLASLPNILFGRDLRAVVDAIVRAYRARRPVILGMGAHVIKCGLSPVIIDLMDRGIITCVALKIGRATGRERV